MSTASATSRWTLTGTAAQLRVASLHAAVDLARPDRGLFDLRYGIDVAGSFSACLGIATLRGAGDDVAQAETYVRGDDLVATYLQNAGRPFRLQSYWRSLDAGSLAEVAGAAVVELQASINTSLLDTQPTVDVTTTANGGVWRELASQQFLFRPHHADWSYWEAAHPSDQSACRLTENECGLHLTHTLFDRPLEKGVILRSRVRGAFLPRATDEAAAAAFFDAFAKSEPPLTT